MAELEAEIATFEAHRVEWEAQHSGKWVLIHGADLAGVFDEFNGAAAAAVAKFGRGPYLIRQMGAPPVVLPASVMYIFRDAAN